MNAYIEPLRVVIYREKGIKGEKSEGFGGFCSCGGRMEQLSWHVDGDTRIIVSECEICWNTEALIFDRTEFVERVKLKVYRRNELKEFLSEILSASELEALIARINGEDYSYSALSRAKKKIESLGLDFEEFVSELIF